MGKRLTQETKIEIIRRYENGETSKTIRRALYENGCEVTRRQIEYLIKNYIKGYFRTDSPSVNLRTAVAVSHRDMEIVTSSLTSNPDQSARDIRKELLQDGSEISLSTVKRVITRCGFTSDVPRYSHMVRVANQQPRVEFCNILINTNDTLDDIIFTDESSVQLHNNKSACYRLIGKGNRQLPKPKHPLKVHVWAGISRRGATPIFIFEGIMDSAFYTSNILANVLVPFIQGTYADRHRFCQDNDPKHKSKFTQKYMKDNGINWWNVWPSESPDLNPIEMVWNQMKRFIAKQEPRTKEELMDIIETFWREKMTVSQCNRYIDHIFKVAPTVVVMGGKATGDIPKKLFPESSEGKSFKHYGDLLKSESVQEKIRQLCV